MPPEHDLPKLEGVTNFRELGGIETRDGRRVRRRRIFRSGHWGRATEADLAVLRELEVERVFDFRSQQDLTHDGLDKLPEDVEHIPLPTSDPAVADDLRGMISKGGRDALFEIFSNGGAERLMCQSASRLVTERLDTYRRFLSGLAEPNAGRVLFHCSAGKDRAGWAGSCVLLALGVEEEEVIEHYLLSNLHYEPQRQGFEKMDEEVAELLRPLIGVRPEYVRASIEAAHEAFGSIEGYLHDGLGIEDEQLEQLRANWLED